MGSLEGIKAYLCTVDGQGVVVLAETFGDVLDVLRDKRLDDDDTESGSWLSCTDSITEIAGEVVR